MSFLQYGRGFQSPEILFHGIESEISGLAEVSITRFHPNTLFGTALLRLTAIPAVRIKRGAPITMWAGRV